MLESLIQPSPLQAIKLKDSKQSIWIKRDDLLHPIVSGNKWRKLKYNLAFAEQNEREGILSFGGAFSNHLYALAGAAKLCKFKSIGIIRTEKIDEDNPTIKFLRSQGMALCALDRSSYRKKENPEFLDELSNRYPNYHIVPEGGSNDLAMNGVREIIQECDDQLAGESTVYICGVGTGTTMAGLISGIGIHDKVYGIAAVDDDSLHEKIANSLELNKSSQYELDFGGTWGGFAKTDSTLIDFINDFYHDYGIPLDPIYNAKVMHRLLQLLDEGKFDSFENVILIHTGGLQGLTAYDYLKPGQLNPKLLSSF